MSYDSFLGTIDLITLADEARKIMGYKILHRGGRIILLGLVLKSAHNLYRIMNGKPANLLSPVLSAVFFSALLVFYKEFVNTTIHLVSHMGNATDWSDNVVSSFTGRYTTFVAWREKFGSYKTYAMEFLVGLLYVGVEGMVVFFRAGQKGILSVIIVYGPLLLGAASLGGFFVPLAMGWFWALLEVSSWSVTMDIILFGYSKMNLATTVQDISLNQELLVAGTLFGMLLAVPAITSFVIRGTAGAGMAAAHTTALSLSTAIISSRFSQRLNTSAYDTVKGAVGKAGGAMRGRVSSGGGGGNGGSGGGTTQDKTEQAWKAAATHSESRATAQRSQRSSQ